MRSAASHRTGDARSGARAGPLLADFKQWLNATLAKLSKEAELAEAIRYMLPRWPALTVAWTTACWGSTKMRRNAHRGLLHLAARTIYLRDPMPAVNVPH